MALLNRKGVAPFDAEDVLQDTLIKVVRFMAEDVRKPMVYFSVCLKSAAVDYHRKRWRERQHITQFRDEDHEPLTLPLEQEVTGREDLAEVLARMTPEVQEVLRRRANGEVLGNRDRLLLHRWRKRCHPDLEDHPAVG